jgi:hypothetical protein
MDAVDEIEMRSLIRELGLATVRRSRISMEFEEAKRQHRFSCEVVDEIKDRIAKIDPGFDFSKPGLYK